MREGLYFADQQASRTMTLAPLRLCFCFALWVVLSLPLQRHGAHVTHLPNMLSRTLKIPKVRGEMALS